MSNLESAGKADSGYTKDGSSCTEIKGVNCSDNAAFIREVDESSLEPGLELSFSFDILSIALTKRRQSQKRNALNTELCDGLQKGIWLCGGVRLMAILTKLTNWKLERFQMPS